MLSGLHAIKPLEIKVEDFQCRLIRLDDRRYRELRQNSLSIQGDTGFLMRLQLLQSDNGCGWLNLAEFYTVFKLRFGESGDCYDDWKSAFDFPFELEIFKGDTVYSYVLDVVNWRGTFEFNFRKVLSSEEAGFNRMAFYQPFEAEFSAVEMNTLVAFLYSYAVGFLESIRPYSGEEFVRQVPSNLILFGFWQGQFFVRQYSDSKEFRTAWEEFKYVPQQEL